MANSVKLRVIGVTDLETSWRQLCLVCKLGSRRKAIRICKLPWTVRKVMWSELVYTRGE